MYLKKEEKIIITNWEASCLFIFNPNNGSIQTFKHELIKSPIAICLGKNDDLFISEHSSNRKILVFDADMNYRRQFNLKQEYSLCDMIIDVLTKQNNKLYITHGVHN